MAFIRFRNRHLVAANRKSEWPSVNEMESALFLRTGNDQFAARVLPETFSFAPARAARLK